MCIEKSTRFFPTFFVSIPRLGIAVFLFLFSTLYTYAQPTKEWDRNFGGDGWEELNELVLTTDGGYIFGGTASFSSNYTVAITIRLSV